MSKITDLMKKADGFYDSIIEELTPKEVSAMFNVLRIRTNKACEMAVNELGIYADAEFKDIPDDLMVFRNIIDVLQGKGE